jgi:hypothetical protein
MMSASERQKCWRAKPDAEIEALRVTTTKAALTLAQAENDLLHQRILDLEAAVASQEIAHRSAHAKADCEVAFLKEENKELQSQNDLLRQRILDLETAIASWERPSGLPGSKRIAKLTVSRSKTMSSNPKRGIGTTTRPRGRAA